MNGEITADVTCKTVYLLRDDGYGIGLSFDEFDRVIDLYEESTEELRKTAEENANAKQ